MAAKKSARKAPRKTSKKTASKKAPVMKKAASGAGLTSVKAHMTKLDHKVAALDEKLARVAKEGKETKKHVAKFEKVTEEAFGMVGSYISDLNEAMNRANDSIDVLLGRGMTQRSQAQRSAQN